MAGHGYRPILSTDAVHNNNDNGPSKSFSGQVLSQKEWAEIKPLIYRLYVEEGKTFERIKPFIAEMLHGHAPLPTRSSFDKKIRRWGFKKKVSKGVANGPVGNSCSAGRTTEDPAVSKGKMTNKHYTNEQRSQAYEADSRYLPPTNRRRISQSILQYYILLHAKKWMIRSESISPVHQPCFSW